jgi:hypothetical protein
VAVRRPILEPESRSICHSRVVGGTIGHSPGSCGCRPGLMEWLRSPQGPGAHHSPPDEGLPVNETVHPLDDENVLHQSGCCCCDCVTSGRDECACGPSMTPNEWLDLRVELPPRRGRQVRTRGQDRAGRLVHHDEDVASCDWSPTDKGSRWEEFHQLADRKNYERRVQISIARHRLDADRRLGRDSPAWVKLLANLDETSSPD